MPIPLLFIVSVLVGFFFIMMIGLIIEQGFRDLEPLQFAIPLGLTLLFLQAWIWTAYAQPRVPIKEEKLLVTKIDNIDTVVFDNTLYNLNQRQGQSYMDGEEVKAIKFKACYLGIDFCNDDKNISFERVK